MAQTAWYRSMLRRLSATIHADQITDTQPVYTVEDEYEYEDEDEDEDVWDDEDDEYEDAWDDEDDEEED